MAVIFLSSRYDRASFLALIVHAHLLREIRPADWEVGSNPFGGDGALIPKGMQTGLLVEQTYVGDFTNDTELHQLVVDAIERKSSRGKSYTDGTNLIVTSNKTGVVDLSRLREQVRHSNYHAITFMGYDRLSDEKSFYFTVASVKEKDDKYFVARLVTIDIDTGEATSERIQPSLG